MNCLIHSVQLFFSLKDALVTNLADEAEKETGVWKSEIAALQQQLAGPSAVCNFLKEAPEAARYSYLLSAMKELIIFVLTVFSTDNLFF